LVKTSRENLNLLIVIALGVLIRLIVIPVFAGPPYGPVDEYFVDGQAARSILDLTNPYLQSYTVSGPQSGVFVYLPFVPIYYAPFYALGDIRYGNIFADVLIMISVYYIAKSLAQSRAIYAPFVYALFPPSIWLTSVSSTNIMVGTAMLTSSIALLLSRRFFFGSVMLGIAIATNQFAFLALPPIAYCYWKRGKSLQFLVAIPAAALIVLPFLAASASGFIYDVIAFQFARPLQSNGSFSLYSVLYNLLGFRLVTLARAAIMIVLGALTMIWLSRGAQRLVPASCILLLLGAFILPVNGFWNYFLVSLALCCALIPSLLEKTIEGGKKLDASIVQAT
jgi:hypothetical protein